MDGDAAAARCDGEGEGEALTVGSAEAEAEASGLAVGGKAEVEGVGVNAAMGMEPSPPGTREFPASHPNTEQSSPSPGLLLSTGISQAPPEPELSRVQEEQSTM